MSFGRFYHVWLQQLQLLLTQLAATPALSPNPDLIERVVKHYEDYYRVKSHFAQRDVFAVFNAAWLTSLERSLHWIGGWRPTTIFHLIYTVSSSRLETRFSDVIHSSNADLGSVNLTPEQLERTTGDMGDISVTQLDRINRLQCETVARENEITKELGRWQEGACDVVSLLRDEEPEIGGLVEVLGRADGLRLGTFKTVVEILTAQQAREFLIAAAELQFGVRGWGLDKDQRRRGC